MEGHNHLALHILVILAIVGLVGATTILVQGDNVSGAARKVKVVEPAPTETEPTETHQLSNTELAEIFPDLDPYTAQGRIDAFMTEEEPPHVNDYYGWLYVDGEKAIPGITVKAVAPGVDVQGEDYVCGEYTIGEANPGLVGDDGFLHCLCGGGKYPDCDSVNIEFQVDCRGDTITASTTGDLTWGKDKKSGVMIYADNPYQYADTQYQGQVLVDGQPAAQEFIVEIFNGESSCKTTTDSSGNFGPFVCSIPVDTEMCDTVEPILYAYPAYVQNIALDLQVTGSLDMDGQPKALTVDVQNSLTSFHGSIDVDGEPAPEGLQVNLRGITDIGGTILCGTTQTDSQGNYEADCFCASYHCDVGEQIVFSASLPNSGSEVDLLRESGDYTWDPGMDKELNLYVSGVRQDYSGSVMWGSEPAPVGTNIIIRNPINNQVCADAEITTPGQYEATCWCGGDIQSCEDGQDMAFEMHPPYSFVDYYPDKSGDYTWSVQDLVSSNVDLSLPNNIMTKFQGTLMIDGIPAEAGTQVDLISSLNGRNTMCGFATTTIQTPGQYEAYCYCGHENNPDCSQTPELWVRAKPSDKFFTYYRPDTPSPIYADENTHTTDITLTDKYAKYTGKLYLDGIPAPEGTPIRLGPDDDFRRCGWGATASDGAFDIDCWCNQDIAYEDIEVPFCTPGESITAYMEAPYYYAYTYGEDTFNPGQQNTLIVKAFSDDRSCPDGTHLYDCKATRPERCMEVDGNLEIVNDCSACGCPPPVQTNDIEKWNYYECCPDGSCNLDGDIVNGEVVCPVDREVQREVVY